MLVCKMRRSNNRSINKISMLFVNQIDFCNHSLTSAAKGIIDGSGHFSFLNAVILERFFLYIMQRGKNPSLGVSEVDSSLNLCVTLVVQLI